ncbi:DMT family transporter [Nocardia sp. NBC_01327]|uniref:DMT family transporter n=1 Tax=Nocardia sp. NBC_01327 TaxID=2903593 RepID=UPI002E0F36EF|nr:DMT family transporter [Nocardia sp. NBC_01327]
MDVLFASSQTFVALGDSHRIPPTVLIVTLVAACAHAIWNAIAHWVPDKLVSITLVNAGGALCAIPLVLMAAPPDPRCWVYLGASVGLHIVYNAMLMMSYRLGDLSQTYPLARGTSPLVVTLIAAVIFSETPRNGQLAGILLISIGLACLVFWGHRTNPSRPSAIAAAVVTGTMIAAYTTVDGIGVRESSSTFGYIGWLMLLEGLAVPFYAVATRRGRLWPDIRPVWKIGLTGGVLSFLAYGLILWAQTRGALADIAALRESSIIVGALIGTLIFGERFGSARIVATLAVVAGIGTLYLA